ncbi:Surfactin synthase thioesterase subunit [Pseudomonas chlororaphis]|uniref:Thioesterase n=1 Tax=Pseudomonas chlororaphis subsp. aurantiaca TaxID=86192 RepID=A0AAJ0ZRS6_9PSED|nr:alpha/beta fold hydrolase [Pseudomonas chlororaphis]AZD45585.1 Putative thioesterase [Pseudomonas chlororaphis subsp. aurantiaca]AZD64060.1 Putative thioesterase [Pseudomonas chlororaphis subsp. aurantiaca]AZD76736.1 Putative thioesterase [Pseudomonas chlororaphis subsp. aurantiaca]MBU4637196.1 thioesterase [Pseudomonas chlororaphis subsp. aurantiaca]QIT20282.1 thioesterase [Pseudomonas chlororaphis subsp. aurantiaca]
MHARNDKWLMVLNSGEPAKTRLICFPQTGADPEQLRNWSTGLAGHIELVLVRLPGHGSRQAETPLDDWPRLLADTFSALRPLLAKPHALFGHGLGGMLAYETAKHAQAHYPGQTRHLFISACRSPDYPSPRPLLHVLPTAPFQEAMLSLGATPIEMPRDQASRKQHETLLRADLKLFESWRDLSSGNLDIPLTAFYGSEDPLAPASNMANWREFTHREFELIEVAGNHFFIKSQRQRLLQIINIHLGLLGE